MKKILTWLIAIIAVVVIAIFFYINKKQEIAVPIPKEFKQLLCIDVDNIKSSLFTDILTNYDDYVKEDEKHEILTDFASSSIQTPHYIVAYTMPSSGAVYIPFSYKNKEKLTNVLVKNGFVFQNTLWHSTKHKNITISFQNKKGLWCIGASPTINQEEITNYHNGIAREPLNSKLYAKLKQSKHHVLYLDRSEIYRNEAVYTLNFTHQNIELKGEGELASPLQVMDAKVFPTSESILSVTYNIPKDFVNQYAPKLNEVQKQKIKRQTGFHLDSLAYYLKHQGNLTLTHFKQTLDTAITYTYDDDFNEVETLKIDTSFVPQVASKFGVQKTGVLAYLMRDSLVKTVNNKAQLVAIPFLNLIATEHNTYISFSNNPEPVNYTTDTTLVSVKAYPNQLFYYPNQYVEKYKPLGDILKELTIEIKTSQNQLKVKGEIKAINKDVHIIAQLKGALIDN